MQDRSERFKKCVANLSKQGGKIVVPKQKSYRWFAPDHKTVIDDCLESLKRYERKILDIINEEPKNKKYYEAHFEALVERLENIQSKELSDLDSTDFKFVVPKSVDYHRTHSDINVNTELGLRFGLVCSFTFVAIPILGILIATGASLSLGLIPLAVIILGALIGAAVGYFCLNFTPYPRESDSSNSYLVRDLERTYEMLEELSNDESAKETFCFG